MKVNVVYNNRIDGYKDALETIENLLIFHKVEFKTFELDCLEHFGDFSFVIGGDGTILKAAGFYGNTPVLGVNIGRVGFLSQACIADIHSAVEAVLSGRYTTEERIMLSSGDAFALNDFVIKGCKCSRTSKFYLEINGKFVCDYIADGLIISTPTGSTAYGLSAGGPVLYPTLDAIVIVPVCPHTLNARPLVVPTCEIITVKTCDELLSVSADGAEVGECVGEISIKCAEKRAALAFLKNDTFYSVLRKKLHWVVSPAGL